MVSYFKYKINFKKYWKMEQILEKLNLSVRKSRNRNKLRRGFFSCWITFHLQEFLRAANGKKIKIDLRFEIFFFGFSKNKVRREM